MFQFGTSTVHTRSSRAALLIVFKRDKSDPSVIVFSEINVVKIRTSLNFSKKQNSARRALPLSPHHLFFPSGFSLTRYHEHVLFSPLLVFSFRLASGSEGTLKQRKRLRDLIRPLRVDEIRAEIRKVCDRHHQVAPHR